jgi:DNA-directed RNA polymerase subunit RPC12/RpoP
MSYPEKRINRFQGNPCYDSFICKACGRVVAPEDSGTRHRNHCPDCLSSLHVDDAPGDRAADCYGIMDPISVWVRNKGEWAIIHRCTRCGHLASNRIAADDNQVKLMSISLKPLASPPFPIEGLAKSFEIPSAEKVGR